MNHQPVLQVQGFLRAQLFTRRLIEENRPITDFLDADYTFLNRPLARLYGLDPSFDPAQAHHFQKVPLPDHRRGGLLGMGSVPTVDPDLRGATTVRDQRTKHRDSPTCFECPPKIDPPGFAL